MNQQAQRDISRKLKVLNHAQDIGNVSKTCRYFAFAVKHFIRGKELILPKETMV